jgi:RNA polymerase sigma-70 factor (ECF subfamily)
MTRQEDLGLVERMLDGEEKAFDAFAEAFFPALYRFALSRLGQDEETAADIVQSTLTVAMRRLDSYRGDSALFTWLCGICRFEISGLRRRARRSPQEVELTEEAKEVRVALEEVSSLAGNQQEELERKETARQVHAALDALPVHYGQALEWKYLHGLSVKEIAARLDLRPKAAESILTRARKAFSARFEPAANALGADGKGSRAKGSLIHWPGAGGIPK